METRFVTIIDGEPSMATPFSEVFIASEDLFAGALVSPKLSNQVKLASSAFGAAGFPFGFVLEPALAGHPVMVYFFGKFTPVFTEAPDIGDFMSPMYLGVNGQVESIPSQQIVQQVGWFWPVGAGYKAIFAPHIPILSM